MFKTGWQMEWENEVRFKAPRRAQFNSFVGMIEPMNQAMTKIGVAASDAILAMASAAKAFEALKKYN